MNRWMSRALPLIDRLWLPLVYPCAWLLKTVRRVGVHRLPRCRKALLQVGVFPLRRHYYEPQFDYRGLRQPLSRDRLLPAIDWNVAEQLQILAGFKAAHELLSLPLRKPDGLGFHFNNGHFESGDAEYWYQWIRAAKPRRVYEIGSGYSTLLAVKAIQKNREDDPQYHCQHVCVEPYEQSWLEKAGVTVIRRRVEEMGRSLFAELRENDILFIDSSHIVRPQGDVLFEYLELLPSLGPGVVVHVHDIFSPKDYPERWLAEEVRFWNEQYLLEAFLSNNGRWRVVGALNYLHHNHYESLKAVAPFLTPDREPGSFYLRRNA